MDRELAELERRYASELAPSQELALRLARAYVRAGRTEDAWEVYAPHGGKIRDPELDAVGSSFAAAELELLGTYPSWLKTNGPPGYPARFLTVEAPPPVLLRGLPRLGFVIHADIEEVTISASHLTSLRALPRLKDVSLRAGYEWGWSPEDRPRLDDKVLSELAALPKLEGVNLSQFVCGPRALEPLAVLAQRLSSLQLHDLEGLGETSLDWVGQCSRLRLFSASGVPLTDAVLASLPQTLAYLWLSDLPLLTEAAIRSALRDLKPTSVSFSSLPGLTTSAWAEDLPADVSRLSVLRMPSFDPDPLLARIAAFTELESLEVPCRLSSDLRGLAALERLTELRLEGPLPPGGFEYLVPLLPRLDELELEDSALTLSELEQLEAAFRGKWLDVGVDGVPTCRLRTFLAPFDSMYHLSVTLAPLTRAAAQRLTEELSVDGRRVHVTAHDSPRYTSEQITHHVTQLARISLQLPALGPDSAWRDVDEVEPFVRALTDAYGEEAAAELGDTLGETVRHVQEALED